LGEPGEKEKLSGSTVEMFPEKQAKGWRREVMWKYLFLHAFEKPETQPLGFNWHAVLTHPLSGQGN